MVSAGARNIDLTRYLVGQVLLPSHERIEMLREYYPAAVDEDWALEIAGLRVQIIKDDGKGGGVLKFGTEVVTSSDGSMSALLGASPGASTAAPIMLELVSGVFRNSFMANHGRCDFGNLSILWSISHLNLICVEPIGCVVSGY